MESAPKEAQARKFMRSETPYVQLLGKHRFLPDRFLLQDEDERWFLWFGDRPGRPLEPIDQSLMQWVTSRIELRMFQSPQPWVALADLPTSPTSLMTAQISPNAPDTDQTPER
jgi:hypothetical protein